MLPTFFLPAAAGRVFKMYTHACTFKKPAHRAGHILKKCIHLPAYFFDGFMHTHACTLFSSLIILPAPFRLPAAGIFPPFLCAFLLPFSSWCFCDCFAAISLPLCRQTYILFCTFSSLLQPIFCTSFSSYIIHRECRPSMKSIWEEKSCKIKKEKYARPSIKILYKQRKK